MERREAGQNAMTENEMIITVRQALIDGLAMYGKNYAVEQNYQPQQVGTNRDPTVYLTYVNDVPAGTAAVSQETNSDTGALEQIERQLMFTRLSFAATVDTEDTDPYALTVVDVIRMARFAVQSRAFVKRMAAQGVGVLRVEEIKSIPVLSDSPGYEKRPVFDIILQHSNELRYPVGEVTKFEYRQYPI